jgi:hypothetical protein
MVGYNACPSEIHSLFGVPRTTLNRHLNADVKKPGSISLGPDTVLTSAQEDMLVQHILVQHILEFERRGFPFDSTVVDIRILAFDVIKANNIKQRVDH